MTGLTHVPARRIVRAVADAAARWADADFPPRVRVTERIVERTGYSPPVVEYALDQLFFSITEPSLEATIRDELGSLDILDGFVERRDRPDGFAAPIGSVCVVSSRTTIGVAIAPAVFALCAKCDVLVKDREDGLVRAFFASLAQELDEMQPAARAGTWNGDDDAVDLAEFDAVVAFGSDTTLERIHARLHASTTFVGYGSKASAGYVGRSALMDEAAVRALADGAARDLMLSDTEGCLSLHALFIERGGVVTPDGVCELIAHAIERAAIEFPPGTRDAGAVARIADARNLAAFRSATGSGSVFSDEQVTYLVVLDPPENEPPTFLPRTLRVHTVNEPANATEYLERHDIPIEALAIAGIREDIGAMAMRLRVNRIARFGDLQRPPLGGNHGGRPRIADFVRWMTRDR